jgi:hypothetical protein
VQNTGRGGSGAATAISGQREIIKEFLALGLSPDLKNGNGKSVRNSAQSEWIRELLAERNAKPGRPPAGSLAPPFRNSKPGEGPPLAN